MQRGRRKLQDLIRKKRLENATQFQRAERTYTEDRGSWRAAKHNHVKSSWIWFPVFL